jgi:hypothetical protein
MTSSFKVADKLSAKISGTERRYVYNAPKLFLLLIMLVKIMHDKKTNELELNKFKNEIEDNKLEGTREIVSR